MLRKGKKKPEQKDKPITDELARALRLNAALAKFIDRMVPDHYPVDRWDMEDLKEKLEEIQEEDKNDNQ